MLHKEQGTGLAGHIIVTDHPIPADPVSYTHLDVYKRQVLEFAANIGSTFYIPLLKQVVDTPTCDLVLRKSDQEFFTKCGKDSGKFACREIWDFFHACPDKNRKREIAYALERAVYYFDPYDYLTRTHYMAVSYTHLGHGLSPAAGL